MLGWQWNHVSKTGPRAQMCEDAVVTANSMEIKISFSGVSPAVFTFPSASKYSHEPVEYISINSQLDVAS